MTELVLLFRELMICLRALQADQLIPNDNLRRLALVAGLFEKKLNALHSIMHREIYPEQYPQSTKEK